MEDLYDIPIKNRNTELSGELNKAGIDIKLGSQGTDGVYVRGKLFGDRFFFRRERYAWAMKMTRPLDSEAAAEILGAGNGYVFIVGDCKKGKEIPEDCFFRITSEIGLQSLVRVLKQRERSRQPI